MSEKEKRIGAIFNHFLSSSMESAALNVVTNFKKMHFQQTVFITLPCICVSGIDCHYALQGCIY